MIAYYTDGALIAQQAEAAGLDVQIVASGSCNSPQFIELGGDSVNGVVTTTLFFAEDPLPEAVPFVAAYQETYDETPNSFAALAYDGVKILARAAVEGGFGRQGLQQALVNGGDLPSVVYGSFKFAADRRVEGAQIQVIQVQDGAFGLHEG